MDQKQASSSSFHEWREHRSDTESNSDDEKEERPSGRDDKCGASGSVLESHEPVPTVEAGSQRNNRDQGSSLVLVTGQGGTTASTHGQNDQIPEWIASRLPGDFQQLFIYLSILFENIRPQFHLRQGARNGLMAACDVLLKLYPELDLEKIRKALKSVELNVQQVFADCSSDAEVQRQQPPIMLQISLLLSLCHHSINGRIKLLSDVLHFDPGFSSPSWENSVVVNDIQSLNGCVLKCFGHMVSYLCKTGPLQLHVQVAPLLASLLGKTKDQVTLHYCNPKVGCDTFRELVDRNLLCLLCSFPRGDNVVSTLRRIFAGLDRSIKPLTLAIEREGSMGHCVFCLPVGNVFFVGCESGEFVDFCTLRVYCFPTNMREFLDGRRYPFPEPINFE